MDFCDAQKIPHDDGCTEDREYHSSELRYADERSFSREKIHDTTISEK